MSPVRSNTIRRTRPDVSAIERPPVKGARTVPCASADTFRGCAKRLKGYVRGELSDHHKADTDESGRTLLGKVRPDS
ncbi:hypothetical protein GCM10010381_21220 [Streptomyces xantholiticus]|nr:hypothetical protein GCM10010381_21220 [Streptomyces xantholiticus]